MKKFLIALFMLAVAVSANGQSVPKHELFRQSDPHGIMMSITAMAVVFVSLIALWVLFAIVGKIISRVTAKNQAKAAQTAEPVKSFTGEEQIAAIVMALHEYQNELYEKQEAVLTINRVARAYSPWSSKIYGLRQTPNKK